jgi:hypothetical protein
VDLAEALAEAVEQVVSDPKAPIVRPDVGDVEAETGLRQSIEHRCDVVDVPSERLLDVHVLEDDTAPETSERRLVTKAVRMEDDIEVGRQALEPVDDPPCRRVGGRQRSVQRDALEAVELAAPSSEELGECLQSIPADGGQLDETPPFAVGPGDCGSPVVALELVRAGGDSDVSRQSHGRRL